MKPLAILENKFGYSSFRLDQERIIESVLARRDTFVLMPTGGGKSICYQVPALVLPGLTVVISPLIALMKDQVDSLRISGIEAAYLNSTQSFSEQTEIIQRAREGKLKLLYLAPERVMSASSRMLETLATLQLSLIAIDEAHCISQWGHDFRPEYLMLAKLKEAFPFVPVIALTATADKVTRKDIVEKLGLKDPAIFVSSFNRPNIQYNVEPKRNSFERLVDFLRKHSGESGIIYCLSRTSTEQLAKDLREQGFSALAYHAGMEAAQRNTHQDKFLRDEVSIIVATIAFGMGINKSNVRFVVHMDLPKNIEGYYQETGRAGRDGLPSEALLFYSYGDVAKLKSFAKIDGNEAQTQIAFQKLDQMAEYGSLTKCRRKFLLNFFDEASDPYCGNCDICLTAVSVYDGTDFATRVFKTVMELEEKFGSGYVIDVLRGSNSIKIHEDHKTLSTYRSGSDLSREQWQEIIKDLLERNYLNKTKGMYPLLTLSPKAHDALRTGSQIMLTRSRERGHAETDSSYDASLFDALKVVRKGLAEAENVAAFQIFSDATLIEMARYLPVRREDMRRISGVGDVKFLKYGKSFLDVVIRYCAEHSLSSRIDLKISRPERRERPGKDSETKRQTLELFKQGYSVEKIGAMRELTVSTVESHLAFYILQGHLTIQEILSPHDISVIRRGINTAENRLLSSIKRRVGDDYSYGQIKLVLADMERERVAVEA